MNKNYVFYAFVIALGLNTQTALCMDDEPENKESHRAKLKADLLEFHSKKLQEEKAGEIKGSNEPGKVVYTATKKPHKNIMHILGI
jgi:hypothetical protein